MKKFGLLNVGTFYFYLNGIQMGFCSVILILMKKDYFWLTIASYNESLIIKILLKLLDADKRPIIIISHLIATVASFYFALITKSRQENLRNSNAPAKRDRDVVEMDQVDQVQDSWSCYKYLNYFIIQISFCVLLGLFWVSVIFLAYIAVHPQDFVSIKPLKPNRYPFSFESGKLEECSEQYEYFADFQSDKPFQNIWITFTWSIVGLLVSVSTLYGIFMKIPYFLDPGAIYLFIYGIHKVFAMVILLGRKCHEVFLLKFVILTEPSVALLSILDMAVSMKIVHLILMVISFCLLIFLTSFRNHVAKKSFKKESMEAYRLDELGLHAAPY
ncbi:uncharacterized protein LOC135833458 isoform X2 [Planococcus citri]